MQVTERTCIATAANTSSVSRLPSADPSTAQIDTTSFASLKSEPEPVTKYSILSSGGRRRSSSHRRRTLLQVFSETASSWLNLDHQEAAAAVVREVTAGPGSGSQARKLLYLPQSVDGSTAAPAGGVCGPRISAPDVLQLVPVDVCMGGPWARFDRLRGALATACNKCFLGGSADLPACCCTAVLLSFCTCRPHCGPHCCKVP